MVGPDVVARAGDGRELVGVDRVDEPRRVGVPAHSQHDAILDGGRGVLLDVEHGFSSSFSGVRCTLL